MTVDPATVWETSLQRVRREIAELVQDIIPQAKSEAWRYFQRAPHVLDREELESVAFEGLAQAARMWEGYCARNAYDVAATNYFGAYATRRMRGAILDHLRASDWVTRNVRQRAKALDAAGDGSGKPDEQLAAETGLTVAQVRATRASVSAKPTSLDEGDRDIPEVADTESQALAGAVLAALSSARADLLPVAQLVLAMRYYASQSFAEIGTALGLPAAEVARVHDSAVRLVHQAMLRAVS